MKKKIANSFKHIFTAAGKNWMEAMRYIASKCEYTNI